jgi:RecB family exonuclease
MKHYPLSFSKLNTFEQCPRKFFHVYIDQTFPTRVTEQMAVGTRVHEALEHYGKAGKPLSSEATKYKPLIDTVLAQPGEKLFEHKMAITYEKNPCAWDADALWLRGIADVLVVHNGTAICIDWKTGKPKVDSTQLTIFALLTFAHFPEVHTVKSSFVWLAHDDLSKTSFSRQYSAALWGAIENRIENVQEAVRCNTFECRPSKLCGWCPAETICPEAYERIPKRSRRKG